MTARRNSSVGTPLDAGPRTWVQIERQALEAWAQLTLKSPRAAALMQHLVANMGHQNAVVISQKTLAKLMRCSVDTVQRGLRDLEAGNWIQTIRLNGPGTVAAYVVSSAVAWGESRDQIRTAIFNARVVADAEDQAPDMLERRQLRRVPVVVPPEEALPAGEGEPGAQMLIPGMEPVLKAKR